MKTRKVVINKCFGGFSISKKAVKMLAEMEGRKCYFFKHDRGSIDRYVPDTESEDGLFWSAFDVKDPNKLLRYKKPWNEMSEKERKAHNNLYSKHDLKNMPENREDKNLIRVIEKLGKDANGRCADLAIVEIPADIEYSIEEYDGNEHIAEKHRTWA